ncbi:MAG: hypothetical protein IPH81_17795 [Candidatus Microthrix sp.]|jgi:hypothetical protein|uniref:Tail assembly chaperone n=1 Tax=Candidatus Neomicrothrix subdominans TaxID=2954438 RepID=A0A936NAM0_9ACTN|nr:hypothetical protein [Candidatus Microthrix sp.]MBK9296718.1 hypothetical protein [Candidatus Microthrix subdominans]
MADDRHTEDEDYPNDAKRLTVDDLDVVDPLFDLDADVVDKEPKRSPGSFRLFGRSWDMAPAPYIDTNLPDGNQNPAGFVLGQLCGLVQADQRDQFAETAFEAYEAEEVSLPSLQKITTKLAAVFENREQRRTAKRAGRPTGAR